MNIRTAHPLNIKFNPAGLRRGLMRALTLTFQRVAIAMRRTEDAALADGEMQPAIGETVIHFGWSDTDKPPDEWVRDDLQRWILASGFRDAIESVGAFLDQAHLCFRFLELGQQPLITQAELQQVGRKQTKYAKQGMAKKFSLLREPGYVDVPDHLASAVVSIQQARNALVHRGGVVGREDVKDGELVVAWRRMVHRPKGPNAEVRDIVFGETVTKEGEELLLGFVPAELRFRLGEPVRFSVAEFQEIVFTLSLVTNPVLQALVEKLKAAGVTRETDPKQ